MQSLLYFVRFHPTLFTFLLAYFPTRSSFRRISLQWLFYYSYFSLVFLPCTRKVCYTKTYDCNGERSFGSIESIADEWPLVKADISQWAKLWVRKASEHDGRCKDEIYQSRPIYGTKWNLSARTSPYRLLLHAQNILRYFGGTRFSIGRT